MERSRAVEGVLAAVIAVLLVAGLVGAATVDEDASNENIATDASTTSSTGLPGDPAPTIPGIPTSAPDGADRPAPTGSGGSATTAARGGSGTTAAPAARDPGPSKSPRLGMYHYSGKKDGEEQTTDLRISRDAESAPGEDRFEEAVREGREGNTLSQFVAWKANGIYVRKTTFPNPAGGPPIEGDWEPDILDRQLPMRAGQEWDADSTCRVTFGAASGTFRIRLHGKTEGARRVTAAGKSLDTWLIVQTAHVDIDFVYNGQPIHAESDTTSQEYFSPPHGLTVKSVEDTTSRDANGKPTTSHTERELRNLDPEA